ncbi:hypothetical protein GCM10010343_60960 [Streptomyces avidinii]|nr:hypothetical protein GCM10010343_60960 [Streptomyces avidinii]
MTPSSRSTEASAAEGAARIDTVRAAPSSAPQSPSVPEADGQLLVAAAWLHDIGRVIPFGSCRPGPSDPGARLRSRRTGTHEGIRRAEGGVR